MTTQTRTDAAESHPNGLVQLGLWGSDPTECATCGRDFDPDSSPNLIECWSCDEQAEVDPCA